MEKLITGAGKVQWEKLEGAKKEKSYYQADKASKFTNKKLQHSYYVKRKGGSEEQKKGKARKTLDSSKTIASQIFSVFPVQAKAFFTIFIPASQRVLNSADKHLCFIQYDHLPYKRQNTLEN